MYMPGNLENELWVVLTWDKEQGDNAKAPRLPCSANPHYSLTDSSRQLQQPRPTVLTVTARRLLTAHTSVAGKLGQDYSRRLLQARRVLTAQCSRRPLPATPKQKNKTQKIIFNHQKITFSRRADVCHRGTIFPQKSPIFSGIQIYSFKFGDFLGWIWIFLVRRILGELIRHKFRELI